MADRKIRKPMYQKEEMGRLVKWFFGIPLSFVAWTVLSFAMPASNGSQRFALAMNILSYAVFIMVVIIVVAKFLRFPFARMLDQNLHFSIRNLIAGFVPMLVLGVGTTFIWKLIQPENFTYSLQSGWPVDFLLAFVLVSMAAFLEEILCRSYVAYFVNDSMEERPRRKLLYCLASAVFFTILHFQNPEVIGSQAIYSMIFYFLMGFVLMAITLRTQGIEAALGIHIANNLANAWFFTYEDAALITNAIYTQKNNIGPMMVVQAAFCVVASAIVVCLLDMKKPSRAEHA